MVKVMIWVAGLYALFKFCYVNFSKKSNRHADESWRDDAVAGEPYILLIAITAALLINLYGYWFIHRLGRREVAHATECYGRVGASESLPGIDKRFDYWTLATFTVDARRTAAKHAKWIGMDPSVLTGRLASSKASYARLYSYLSNHHQFAEIDRQMVEIDRCIKDQWAPHGEILNP